MDYQPGTDVSDKSLRLADSWRFFVYESIGWPDDGWGDKEEAADDFLTKASFLLRPHPPLNCIPTSAERGHFSSISISKVCHAIISFSPN